MVLLIAFLGILAPSMPASAQTAQIISLFESRSLIPGFLLPFKVSGGTLQAVSVETQPQADCRAMIDPHTANHFHVKCKGETSLTLRLVVENGSYKNQISYGPVNIVSAGAGLPIQDPSTPSGPSAEWLAGKQLYNSYCMSCHAPPSLLKNKTVNDIKGKIQTVAVMNYLGSALSNDDLQKISSYLKDPK